MNLSLAFSTCPNDTFSFDALVNGRIERRDFSFDVLLADIQELNALALKGEVDVVKISFALYPSISNNYQLLTAGSALGKGVGPLLISKRKIYPDEVAHICIAIPGEQTTANLLFSLAFPNAKNKRVYLFSDIEEALLSNEVDAGVIIHENRFTYQKMGLKKIIDLGEYWESQANYPIPLGGIAIRRDLPLKVKKGFNNLLKRSIETAMANPAVAFPYVRKYAQSMDVEVMKRHVDLYVNKHSIDIGEPGRKAIAELFRRAKEIGFCEKNQMVEPFFVD